MDKNVKAEVIKMIENSGMTRAAFAREYHIPIRTLENWTSGKCACPGYVLNLLNRCTTQPPAPLHGDVMPLRELRDKCGLTRAAFSREYDIPVTTLERWEGGTSKCPPYVAEMLERCVRFDHLPVYFAMCRPKGHPEWYISHSQCIYFVTEDNIWCDATPQHYVTRHSHGLGYDDKHACELELKKAKRAFNKMPYISVSKIEFTIMRLEEVLALL